METSKTSEHENNKSENMANRQIDYINKIASRVTLRELGYYVYDVHVV